MVTKNGDGTYTANIRDHKFDFCKWGAEKSLLVFSEISRMAAAGLGDASMMLSDVKRGEAAGKFISFVIKGIGDGLGRNPKATLELIKTLCCDEVHCDGAPMQRQLFDTFFREDIFFAFEVAQATLRVQYETFFEKLKPVLALMRQELKPNTSA